MFEKHLQKSDILSKYVGFWRSLQVFFKHFASKNQQPGFYIKGTLVDNELITRYVQIKTKHDHSNYLII